MSEFNDAPVKYKTWIDLEKVATVKQEFTLTNGEVVKLGWEFRRKQEHFLPSKRNDIPFVPASAGIPIGIFAFRNKS